MFMSGLKSKLRSFVGDNDGYITVEAMIVLPALLWLFGAGWVYFDAFRQQSVNQKANYVVGDVISRETDPLDDAYIDSARDLFYTLTKSHGAAADIRISAVQFKQNGTWELNWSEARGAYPELSDGDIADYQDRLPGGMSGDQLLLIETWEDHVPVINVGLAEFEIRTYSFTRPRYTPQILFEDPDADGNNNSHANNGYGNGDQDAPGQSLCNNNAENADEGAIDPECDNSESKKNKGGKNKGGKA